MYIQPHNCNQDSKGQKQGAAYQDKKYGPGKRAFTTTAKGERGKCTVCGQK